MFRLTRPALVALACGLSVAAVAAAPLLADTFGNIRYNTPKDWKASVTEKSIFLSPKGEKALMAIVLVPGVKSDETAEEGVKKTWRFFTKSLEMEGEVKSQKSYKTNAGVRFVTGMGQMTKGEDESMLAMVNVFEANGNLESVVVLAKDFETLKKYSEEVATFLNEVEFGPGKGVAGDLTKVGGGSKKDTVESFIKDLRK
jgi:hypothetical protein